MDKNTEIVEVAILKCMTHYSSYDDPNHVLARLMGEDWVKMTRREMITLQANQYDIARELGIESLVVFEKPSKIEYDVCISKVKELIKSKEAERQEREKRAERQRAAAAARAKEQAVAKAKKALAKAQKVLKEAGEL